MSVLAVAKTSGLARPTIEKAEAGTSSPDSQDRLEAYYDQLDTEKGVDSRPEREAPESEHGDMIEFDITGPTTAWHVVVRAPVEQADEARRQAGELLREWEATRGDR